MPLAITEDGVFSHMPDKTRRPADTPRDGDGGVSASTYARMVASQLLETEARLRKEGVEQTLWEHLLVQDFMEMCLAARICRRLRTYQELADSLFADANIKLNLFLEGFAGVAEDIGPAQAVEFGDMQDWLPNSRYINNGFVLPTDSN